MKPKANDYMMSYFMNNYRDRVVEVNRELDALRGQISALKESAIISLIVGAISGFISGVALCYFF